MGARATRRRSDGVFVGARVTRQSRETRQPRDGGVIGARETL